jgi:membrane-associated phospholipid phosphatase
MHWQFIAIAGFIAAVALFLVALFLTQKGLRFRSDRARTSSNTDTGCGS